MFDRKLLLQHIGNRPKDITEQAKQKEPKYHYDFTQGTHKNMLERNVSNDTQIYTTYHEALRHIHDNAPDHVPGDPSSISNRADYYAQPFHVVNLPGNRLIKMPRAYDITNPTLGTAKMNINRKPSDILAGNSPVLPKPKPDPDVGPRLFTHPKYDKIRAEFE